MLWFSNKLAALREKSYNKTIGARGTELPHPVFNFLFTDLFSIEISLFLYHFISFALF
jgi:hypothetical protein